MMVVVLEYGLGNRQRGSKMGRKPTSLFAQAGAGLTELGGMEPEANTVIVQAPEQKSVIWQTMLVLFTIFFVFPFVTCSVCAGTTAVVGASAQ